MRGCVFAVRAHIPVRMKSRGNATTKDEMRCDAMSGNGMMRRRCILCIVKKNYTKRKMKKKMKNY